MSDPPPPRLPPAFQDATRCELLAKGPTFRPTDDAPAAGTLRVCVNEAAIFAASPDLVVCNDVEPLEHILAALEDGTMPRPDPDRTPPVILAPEHPHRALRPGPRLGSYALRARLEELGFRFVAYNLRTAPRTYPELPTLRTALSSAVTAVEFVARFAPRVALVQTRGLARGPGYHPLFAPFTAAAKAPSAGRARSFARECERLCGARATVEFL